MKRMMITLPIIIPASKENLKLPNEPTDIHLLFQKMALIVSAVMRLYKKWNLDNTTIDLIINSWRGGTRSQL